MLAVDGYSRKIVGLITLPVILQNGSHHRVVASCSGLYEEGDVDHINVFGLVF